MTLANRLRWFLGRLISPARTPGAGEPPTPDPDDVPTESETDAEPRDDTDEL